MDSARKLALDASTTENLAHDARTWELVVRETERHDAAGGHEAAETAYLRHDDQPFEQELDAAAVLIAARAQGLHRLNRTNPPTSSAIFFDLPIDAAKSAVRRLHVGLRQHRRRAGPVVHAPRPCRRRKNRRLTLGYPEQPTLAVYPFEPGRRDPQDYHLEGMPFGARGGLVVPHLFPSDGEYQMTVTPIFGETTSPTGFRSVPCERMKMLLDGERLSLVDWVGGGRQAARPTASPAATRSAPPRSAVNKGPKRSSAAGAAPRCACASRPRRARTTWGPRASPANFAPLLDLDKHFMRDTLQTERTAGYTFFPHIGTIRIEGPFEATQAVNSPTGAVADVHAEGGSQETACARRIVTRLATSAFRRPATAADVDGLMEFYASGRRGEARRASR